MTNKEGADEEESVEPRLAAFLALHLVSQVLDEAYIIANAANDSGQPWRYLSILKNLRSGKLGDPDEGYMFVAPDKSCIRNVEYIVNNLATSTPQKLPDDVLKALDESLIGQGDEDFESPQSDFSKATSTFINNMFDMSEVENINEDTGEINIEQSETYNVKNVSISRIVESCVDAALLLAIGAEKAGDEGIEKYKRNLFRISCDSITEVSIDDALNTGENSAICIDDIHTSSDRPKKKESIVHIDDKVDAAVSIKASQPKYDSFEKEDFSIYERAYLTLNRDDDHCSENNEFATPLLDPKKLIMQDVELNRVTNQEDVSVSLNPEKTLDSVQPPETASKSSLTHRCRVQGTRLLARLRGWLRRKIPGRRVEYRVQKASRNLCPQSPDPRRRVASLRASRHLLFSPSPSSSALWKYNTVNEGIINSSRWNENKCESNPNDGLDLK